MSKQEILHTRYRDMCDMISCFAIFRGAKPKNPKRHLSFEEALLLR